MSTELNEEGIYLLDNGYVYIIYIKQKMRKEFFQSLFGINDIEDLQNITYSITEDNVFNEPDALKQRVINIIDFLRRYFLVYA